MKDLRNAVGAMCAVPMPGVTALHALAGELRAAGRSVRSLAFEIPRFEPPAGLLDSCIEWLRQGEPGGAPAAGLPELRRALAEKLCRDCKVPCTALNLVVTPGERFARFAAIAALCGPGDEVILPVPCRMEYRALVHAAGATCVELRTRPQEGFELEPGLLEAAVTGRTRLLILNTPSWPAGTVYRRETLEALAAIAVRHNFMVLSDECLASFVGEPDRAHVSFASLSDEAANRCITLGGFSAGCFMENHPVGFVAAPEWLSGRIIALQQLVSGGASALDQHCALAALTAPVQQEMAELRRAIVENREWFCRSLETVSGLELFRPAGGLSLLCGIAGFGMDSDLFCERLLREELLEAVPGRELGAEGYIGLSFACPASWLKDAAGSLAAFCGKIFRSGLNKEGCV